LGDPEFAVSAAVQERDQIGTTVSLEDAVDVFGRAEELPSPMVSWLLWAGTTLIGIT